MARPAAVLLLALTAASVAGAALPPCGGRWAGHDAVTFYLDFEDTTWAAKAVGNPYQVGRHFRLLALGPPLGDAWTNDARDGYVAYDGTGNVPVESGTVSLLVSSGDTNIFADGKPHCIASLPRTIDGMARDEGRWGSTGLALSLRKTAANTLDLLAHIGGDHWMRGAEAVPVISLDASGLSPGEWHHIAFSWHWPDRRLWLVVDGEEHEAEIPEALEEPWPYLAACFGNSENYLANAQEPLDGYLDEIAIIGLPWPEAHEVMQGSHPLTSARPEVPGFGTQATLFPDDEQLARLEWLARNHLNVLLAAQNHGGWDLNIQWPSLMGTNAKTRLPAPGTYVQCSKDSNTAFGAGLLAWGYDALGDDRYLEAAERAGEMYLRAQAEEGWWCHGYYYQDGEYLPAADLALIQDHVQTGPMFLLAYLHHISGDERYLNAAKRSADFLLRAQNPNGSWSHHWEPERQAGISVSGAVGAGEVNDYGTSGPVEALLWLWRLTGEERYREAALRGADWLVDVLIETEDVVGWAGQYDAEDQPIPARHHEPSAVTQYAPRWAAKGLFAAHRATHDGRYLEPIGKVLAWFEATETEQGGWWWDYDIETGRPMEMYQRQIYFVDDPEQLQAFVDASGQATPQPGDWVQVGQLRRELEHMQQSPEGTLIDQPTRRELASWVGRQAPHYIDYYVGSESQSLNEEAGLFTHMSTAGGAIVLAKHQVVRFLDLLMRARAARGDIPAEDPVFRHIEAYVGWHKILLDYDDAQP